MSYSIRIDKLVFEEIPKYQKAKVKKPYYLEGKLKSKEKALSCLVEWYGDWARVGNYRTEKGAIQAKERYERHSCIHIIYSRLKYRITEKGKLCTEKN